MTDFVGTKTEIEKTAFSFASPKIGTFYLLINLHKNSATICRLDCRKISIIDRVSNSSENTPFAIQ